MFTVIASIVIAFLMLAQTVQVYISLRLLREKKQLQNSLCMEMLCNDVLRVQLLGGQWVSGGIVATRKGMPS